MHAQGGTLTERRDGWQSSVLAPLYGGRDPEAWSEDINGVRFVALDNSTGEVSAEQVAFFTQATFEINDQFALVAGVRYAKDDKDALERRTAYYELPATAAGGEAHTAN